MNHIQPLRRPEAGAAALTLLVVVIATWLVYNQCRSNKLTQSRKGAKASHQDAIARGSLALFEWYWVYNARLPIRIDAGDEIRQVFFRFHPVVGVTLLLTTSLLGHWVTPGLGMIRSMLPLTAGVVLIGAGALAGARLRRRLAGYRWRLLVNDLLGILCWAALLYGLTRVFQLLLGVSGMWPLKAGIQIAPVATLALPALLFAAWVGLHSQLAGGRSLMTTDRAAARSGAAILIVLGGILLPVALKASVRGGCCGPAPRRFVGASPRLLHPGSAKPQGGRPAHGKAPAGSVLPRPTT